MPAYRVLQTLDLSQNSFSDASIIAILDSIKNVSSLTELNLFDSKWFNTGYPALEALAVYLSVNESLQALHFSLHFVDFGVRCLDEGSACQKFAHTVVKHPLLKELNYWNFRNDAAKPDLQLSVQLDSHANLVHVLVVLEVCLHSRSGATIY